MPEIVLTGSVAYDYLMTYPGKFSDVCLPEHLDSLSLSFLVDSLVKRRGGIAPNIAYTLALLGEHPTIMATVGDDFAPDLRLLAELGIDTSAIKVIRGKATASFFATTDQVQAQIASFYPGAMDDAASLSIHDLPERPRVVMISPNSPDAMAKYVRECREAQIPYFYDPSQQVARLSGEPIRDGVVTAAALFCNEYEFAVIQQKTGLSDKDIFARVPLVVVTRGAKGASIYDRGEEIRIPVVPPKQIADPTGVGDAFRGGFLKGYLHGLDLETSGKMGALAATYCLESQGPEGHFYTPQEFLQRFQQVFGEDAAARVAEVFEQSTNSADQN